jgi:hypothetical protein
MGRMGMELGITPGLLQSRGVGGLGESLSSAAGVVSPAAYRMDEPAGLWRKLALSSATLSASSAGESAGVRPSTVWTGESSRLRRRRKSASTAGKAGRAGSSAETYTTAKTESAGARHKTAPAQTWATESSVSAADTAQWRKSTGTTSVISGSTQTRST